MDPDPETQKSLLDALWELAQQPEVLLTLAPILLSLLWWLLRPVQVVVHFVAWLLAVAAWVLVWNRPLPGPRSPALKEQI